MSNEEVKHKLDLLEIQVKILRAKIASLEKERILKLSSPVKDLCRAERKDNCFEKI